MINIRDRRLVFKIGLIIASFSLLTMGLVGLALTNIRSSAMAVQGVMAGQQQALYLGTVATEKTLRMHQRAFEVHVESDKTQVPGLQAAFEQEVAELEAVLSTLKPYLDKDNTKYVAEVDTDLPLYVALEKRGHAMVLAGDAKGFEDLLQGDLTRIFDKMDEALKSLVSEQHSDMNDAAEDMASLSYRIMVTMSVLGFAGLVLVAAGSIALVLGQIARPVAALTSAMSRLAKGDTGVEVPARGRKDEIGEMAEALQRFKEAAIETLRLSAEAADTRQRADHDRQAGETTRASASAEQTQVVDAIAGGLGRLSAGVLAFRIEQPFAPDYDKLRTVFNAAMEKLQDTMVVVAANTSAIRSGTDEISSSADDLSKRTEQQAASLEETAAALDQITATVRKTAEGSKHAREVVGQAKTDAEQSGRIVRQAVEAMSGIEKSAGQISQIIGVIDEIAFQTNLLALNAGVEAARAGDAGRGFAVVASEVRALAQRSADAAKEIKALISASSQQVEQGVDLVGQTGSALDRIVAQVTEINGIVGEIAASAQEQATGLDQVNTAVNQMDQVTQQNAAMVEQSTAASRALAQKTEELGRLIANFDVGSAGGDPARSAYRPAARLPAKGRPGPVTALRTTGRGGAAPKPASDPQGNDWTEF